MGGRKFLYLLIVSFSGLFVAYSLGDLFHSQGWIIPHSGNYEWGLAGIISDVLIAGGVGFWLVLMAWLPGKLDGPFGVTVVLMSVMVGFRSWLFVGNLLDYRQHDFALGVTELVYDVRALLIFTLVPALTVEIARRILPD